MRLRRWRRWLIFAPFAVVLGMATSVGIAWWIAWRSEPPPPGDRFGFSAVNRDCWFVRRNDASGVVLLDAKAVSAWASAGERDRDPTLVPAWSRFNEAPREEDVAAGHPWTEFGFGWPRIAITYSMRQRGASRFPVQYEILDGRRIEGDGTTARNARAMLIMSGQASPRVLPLRPHWPALLVNGLFWGAIWLVVAFILVRLAAAPFVFRRWRRRATGRCVKCGYDLRGDLRAGCPECGWRRSESPAEPLS